MVSLTACPAESDARETIEEFIRNPSARTIGSLRTDGFDFLHDLVINEIKKQEPESEIIEIDREFLIDNGIDFARDLQAVLEKRVNDEKKINWVVNYDIPVKDWQYALDSLKGKNTQVYFITVACRQVPCCYKLLV